MFDKDLVLGPFEVHHTIGGVTCNICGERFHTGELRCYYDEDGGMALAHYMCYRDPLVAVLKKLEKS